MSQEPKINKTTAYLAATGAFATGAFLLTAPLLVTVPLVALAVAPVALSPNRSAIVARIQNETKALWQDLTTHVTKDMNSLRSWWNNRKAATVTEAPRAPQSETPSAFNPSATAKNDFGASVKPGQTAEEKPAVAPVATPAAKPDAPKNA